MDTNVVTKEMLDAARKIHGKVDVYSLDDADGNNYGDIMLKVPSPKALSEWEKWLDKDPMKSRRILVNATLVNRIEEIKDWAENSNEFYAAYNSATFMIPTGKGTLKKL